MRRILTLILAGSLMAGAVHAQVEEETRRGDSLRTIIQERFARAVQEQLGLSQEQADKMRVTSMSWFARRRNLEIQERRLRMSLAGQMRPGVPANQDSVARLTDALLTLKISQVETYRDELREMTYLTPVQRAQFFIMRDRLLRRIEEVREQQDTAPPRLRRRP